MRKKRSGFTLIELIMVMGIMLILASLMFGVYAFVQQKSSTTRTKSALNMIRSSIIRYYDENQTWPNVFNNGTLRIMITPETAAEDAVPPPGSVTDFDKQVLINAEDWLKMKSFFNLETGNASLYTLKDLWGKEFKVRRSGQLQEAMKASHSVSTSLSEAEECRNQGTFDLFSLGPNGEEDTSSSEIQDDIWPDI